MSPSPIVSFVLILFIFVLPVASPPCCKISVRATTYTRELGAAVTALGGSAALLDVQNSEVTAGSLDDSGPVGASVVAAEISPVSMDFRRKSRATTHGRELDSIRFAFAMADDKNETHPLRRR